VGSAVEQEKDSSNLNDKNNEEEDYSPDESAIKKFNICCFFVMYSMIAFVIIAAFISGFVFQNMNDPEMAVNLWSAIVAAIGFAILPLIIHVWELIRRKRGWEPLEEGFTWKGIKLDDFKLLEDSEEKFEFVWDQSESGYTVFLFAIFMQILIIITMIISIMYGGVSLVYMIIANVIFVPGLIIGSIIYMFFV